MAYSGVVEWDGARSFFGGAAVGGFAVMLLLGLGLDFYVVFLVLLIVCAIAPLVLETYR